ncbi:hypothetical protein [Candidatus Chloroploca sp. Khr17]|uniref:hypothetical protein n=1 Tax=Candidatus Chloroploca sp. Khr17 TaxID=2496869 RepID=UPI00101C41C6|nr:hypothetical protein [Candidatus Chloroploca sp. Khr17]
MIQQAFDAFVNGDQFETAVMSSTTAGFGGSGYSVELFEDGTFRVLWDNEIGNRYVSPGLILGIPQYDQDTITDLQDYGSDADLSFALDEIRAEMRAKLEDSA